MAKKATKKTTKSAAKKSATKKTTKSAAKKTTKAATKKTTKSASKKTTAAGSSKKSSPKLTYDQIKARAFEIWVRKGKPDGLCEQNWKEAEAELKAELS